MFFQLAAHSQQRLALTAKGSGAAARAHSPGWWRSSSTLRHRIIVKQRARMGRSCRRKGIRQQAQAGQSPSCCPPPTARRRGWHWSSLRWRRVLAEDRLVLREQQQVQRRVRQEGSRGGSDAGKAGKRFRPPALQQNNGPRRDCAQQPASARCIGAGRLNCRQVRRHQSKGLVWPMLCGGAARQP